MTKNILLATAALGLIAFAGQASAHDLSFRATAAAGDIDANAVNQTPRPFAGGGNADLLGVYLIANEALGSQLGSGILALTDELSAGAALPSGNNLYTITLSPNATFGAPVTNANVRGGAASGGNCTVVLSSGGQANSRSVTFLVSTTGGGGGQCIDFDLDLPVLPSAVGTVTVTTDLRTDGFNTPIDGGTDSLDVITAINAFEPAVSAAITGNQATGSGSDSFARLVAPTYTTLSADPTNDTALIGRLAIYVDTRAQRNLTPGTFVTLGDVTDADITIEGNFNAFNANLSRATFEGVNADSITANLATFNNRQGVLVENQTARPTPGNQVRLTTDGGVIDFSTYFGNITYTLTTTNFVQEGPARFQLETIEREGTNVILPWMNDQNIATTNGSSNTVRVGNMSGNPAQVSARVRNNAPGAAGAGFAINPNYVVIGTAPARGELQITTDVLTNRLGAFGRGDVELVIEAAPADVTTRRYLVRNGVTTEVSNGSIASEQTPDDINDIQ